MSRFQVLIDGVAFETATRIGIWRLFYEVMSRTSSEVDYVLLLHGKPAQPIPSRVHVHSLGSRFDPTARRNIIRKWWSWPFSWKLAHRNGSAIWHSSFYTRDPRAKPMAVVTLHDMIAEVAYATGHYYDQRRAKAQCLQQASALLAVSQCTADDLLLFYPSLEPLVQVVHLGYEHLEEPCLTGNSERKIVQEYCLFVGGRYTYKNFSTLIEALSLPEWPEHLKLVVAGAPFDDAERAWIRANRNEDRVIHVGKVSNQELGMLYRHACCFVFPSLAEGFGIPVLESQCAGTVTVLSNIKVFREIAGEGAIYVSPHSPSSIALGVRQALIPSIRGRVLEHARRNLDRFSWDVAASKTLECYERVHKRFSH